MKANKWHFVYLFILAVLAVGIGMFFSRDRKPEVIYHTTTDTVFDTVMLLKIDTLKQTKFVCVTEKVVDTLWLTDTVDLLPISQKHYSKDSVYDIWVSGVYPKVDSVNVYQKMEYKTMTKEITKEVFPQKTEWYVLAGLNSFNGTLSPKVGISIKTKKEWLISPEISLYDNKTVYGITIGKKIK